MKNAIKNFAVGFAAVAAAALLLGAAATATKYTGVFVGHGGSLTNAAGTTMNALKASVTNVAAGATIGAANGGALTNSSGVAFNAIATSDASAFPTSTVPVGSATATNVWTGVYKGYWGIYATNRAVGGWMVQTNNAAGVAVWGPFEP